MKIHELIANTPEWEAHRLNYDNASEAAAMLGLSKTTSRTELLHMKHTGLGKEFSDWVRKNVLDHGHEVEAMARPIVEEIIGENLYPVTCTLGRLGASLDGLTMAEQKAFEHKQWAAELAASVANDVVPDYHMPQCQQILLITKAEELYFVVSDGTRENMVYTIVKPDPAWFERIEAGWQQFHADLDAYVPVAVEVKAIGKTPETLPALHVELTGAVTASNLAEYKEHALAVIGSINRELFTDQDFANAAKAVKWCGDVESRLKAVKEHALSQTKSIDQLFKTIDEITAEARDTRLELDKLVTRRNIERKAEIVLGGKTAYQDHLASLKEETEGLWIELPVPDFAASIKGMRLFANMQDAVNTLLANSKITADDSAKKIRGNLALLAEVKDHAFLFNDRTNLIGKAADDLKLLIKSRIDAHVAAKAAEEEATRARIQAEEQAKAEKAARAKLADEQAKAALAERDRIAEEAAKVERIVTAPDVAPKAPEPEFTLATAPPSHQTVVVEAPAPVVAPVATVLPFVAPARPAPSALPTLKLGDIGARLAPISISGAGLSQLGFEPSAINQNSRLYYEHEFQLMCAALVKHLQAVQAKQAA